MDLGNPYNVEDEQDMLHVPTEREPRWSENLVCVGNDLDSGLSFYAHFSRVAPDPRVWEGVLCLHLPDGDILVSRSFAATAAHDRADTGAMSFTCVSPCSSWHLHFDGMARRVRTEDLAAGPLTDGPVEPLTMDIAVEAVLPPWGSGTVEGQDWGNLHIEQAAQLTGTVTINDRPIAYSARGFRDHSRGPRDHSTLAREGWSFGFTPSGKVYFAVRIWQDDGAGFETGMIFDGTRIHDITSVDVPAVTTPTGQPRDYAITLGGTFGSTTVTAHQHNATPFTLHHPIGQGLGVDVTDRDATMLVEGPITFDWDGEQGQGWMERLTRVNGLPH